MASLPQWVQPGRGECEGVRVCRGEDKPLGQEGIKVRGEMGKGECEIES